ncbi:MAG: serine hydrolase [Gaiellaceae bacterium]
MRAKACAGLLLAATLLSGSPAPAEAAPATWHARISSAVAYAETRSGQISFAVVDESGRLRGYRTRAVAPSASLLKAMLLVAYLRKPDVRDRSLAQWERDLLAPMIRRSDNPAAFRLIGLVGETGLVRLARAAGMEHFKLHWPNWGQSESTPRGQARFLYRIDSLLPFRHRAYALDLLAGVVPSQRWGVGRVPHPGWRLYFKGGWSTGTGLVDHQVALYTASAERFSVALFTRFNPNHDYGKETLKGLAARLSAGVPRPVARAPRAARFAADGGYAALAPSGCATISLRAFGGGIRPIATGASSCEGFKLTLAGGRVLWSREESGNVRLATASFAEPVREELGAFGPADPFGALAGGSGTLAYSHGDTVTVVGGTDCAVPEGSVLAAGFGRIATAAAGIVEVRDGSTCALVRSLAPGGSVDAVALADDLLAVLSRGAEGAKRLDRYRLSSGARLGRTPVASATLPVLAVRSYWIAYRSPHALRVLDPVSGRVWTVWRPRRAPVGLGLAGRRLAWSENAAGSGRLWLLPLSGG